MLESNHEWSLLTLDMCMIMHEVKYQIKQLVDLYLVILVVHDHDHCVVVHGLANEELKVLEPPQNILHVAIDVLLEGVHLVRPTVGLEIGDNLLHIVLQVHCVVLL